MNATGLTERLVRWSRAVVGKLPGGLAQAQLVATAIFGGISGSALGDIAALGTVFIPNLQKEGYGKDFACALTAASAVADPIIPPSIIIVIYAAVMNTSSGAMYAAAILPGFMLIFGDMVIVHYLAKKRDYPRRHEPISMKELALGTRDATLALIMPLIILGGIFLGVFTPTEAAAVAAAYDAGHRKTRLGVHFSGQVQPSAGGGVMGQHRPLLASLAGRLVPPGGGGGGLPCAVSRARS